MKILVDSQGAHLRQGERAGPRLKESKPTPGFGSQPLLFEFFGHGTHLFFGVLDGAGPFYF